MNVITGKALNFSLVKGKWFIDAYGPIKLLNAWRFEVVINLPVTRTDEKTKKLSSNPFILTVLTCLVLVS